MGLTDKISGRVKKTAGDISGDESLKGKGAKEEQKGEAKDQLDDAQGKAAAKANEVADLERKT